MKCSECGMCREYCPVFKAVLRETASPRAKGALKREETADKIFYLCTLCMQHLNACPVNGEEDIIKMRERLVKRGVELNVCKRMIENLRMHGNPFGKEEEKRSD